MATLADSFCPYFYLHLAIIQDLWILIPFTMFKVEFLATANIVLS